MRGIMIDNIQGAEKKGEHPGEGNKWTLNLNSFKTLYPGRRMAINLKLKVVVDVSAAAGVNYYVKFN